MRGISAHSNGFQTARALHVLQVLIGAVEVPGGFRFEPPYPKPVAGASDAARLFRAFRLQQALDGPHLGFPAGPRTLR
jgi:anaerobic selenocysteine-containing dehydrogenase